MESDIDQFIRNQKVKLQQERQQLADDERGERVGRRQWEDPGRETQYAEQNVDILRSPEIRLPLSSETSETPPQNQFQRKKRPTPQQSATPRKNTPDKRYNRTPKDRRLSRRTPTPEAGLNKLGKYEERRKQLIEERHEEFKAAQTQLTPEKTTMDKDSLSESLNLIKELDHKKVRQELMKERRQDYENYLQTNHSDLLPILSKTNNLSPSTRHYIKRSPSLHHPMLPHFSFDQFKDQRGDEEEEENGQDYPHKSEIDYKEWERSFQNDKKKSYNDYLEQLKHRRRKQPTPPGSGMKFGEYEEYRKKIDRQRKQDYKKDLQKQQQEQLLLKAQRDQDGIVYLSPRIDPMKESLDHEISDKIMNQKFREFDKMMAVNKKHDQQRVEPKRFQPENQGKSQPWQEYEERFQRNPPETQVFNEPRNRPEAQTLKVFDEPRNRPEAQTLKLFDEPRNRPEAQFNDLRYRPEEQTQPQYEKPQPQFEKPSEPSNYNDTYTYQKHREKLKAEREKETKQFFEQRGEPQSNRKYPSPKEETGLPLGKYEDKRKKLDEERKREYNALLAKQAQKGKRSKAAQIRDERTFAQAPPQTEEREFTLVEPEVLEDRYTAPQRQDPEPSYNRDGRYDPSRQLQEEKEREYYDLVNKLQQGREENDRPRVEQGRPSSYTEAEKRALTVLEEKEKEYQQLLRERQERERDNYRERDRDNYREQLPPKPPTPGGMFNKLGAHDRQRDKLNEERREEYNKLITEQAESFYEIANTYRSILSDGDQYEHNAALIGLIKEVKADVDARPEPGDRRGRSRPVESQREYYEVEPETRPRPSTDEGISLKGLNPRDSAEIRKKQIRNEEYNEFLRQKGGRNRGRQTEGRPPLPLSAKNPRHGYNDTDPRYRRVNSATSQREKAAKEDTYATLPGLHYGNSADKRKMAQRNKEYNEMLQKTGGTGKLRRPGEPPGPRRGWQSPSYDEILDRKRQEEADYRRDDPGFSGLRAYKSEGAIDSLGNDRYKELDREYETRKVRFRDQRSNILEDDQWLDADQARRDAQFSDLQPPPPAAPRGPPPKEVPTQEMATTFLATLPVGGNERDSAKRRRQSKYREELQLQMQEAEASRRREKVEDLRVNATGLLDPEKTSRRIVNLGQPDITPRRNTRSPEVRPYHTKFDLSPRGGRRGQDVNIDLVGSSGYPSERGRPSRRDRGRPNIGSDGGLLDTGFEGLLERPRPAPYMPPGVQYTPSFSDPSEGGRLGNQRSRPERSLPFTGSYITGGVGLGGNLPLSSIDQAYHFYANRNPLEPEGTGGYSGPDIPLNRLDDGGYRDRASPPRVSFEDNTRNRSRSRDRISPYHFAGEDDGRSKSRQDAVEYKAELERQIQEKRYRDKKAQEEKERYERKLEDEIRNYNPFGRAGGGAPMKDVHGNAVTDLRSMHYENQNSARSPPPRESPRFRAPADPKDDLIKPPPVQQNAKGENTYARGGHGFFGNPKTDAEKSQADKYKEDLRLQIEEKKRTAQLEREKEKIEEEKENRRLEEQRIRIQSEYDEELRKKKEKEEEARRKNEELRQQAEDRKKAEQRKRQEESEAKSRERQEEQERERLERQRDERGSSPPIPAVRNKMATENGEPSASSKKPSQSDKPRPSNSPQRTQYNTEDYNQTHIQGYDHFRTSSVTLEVRKNKTPVSKSPTSDARGSSPPVPSLRSKTDEPKTRPPPSPVQRAASSDVLKELATMRKQLQSERKRVENALEHQQKEPDIFDPRVVQRPPPRPPADIDVFERAKQGHAAVPQRPSDTANAKTLKDFHELKYKSDGASRQALRSMYPDIPNSGSALEVQQTALLRHQEDQLKNMKDTIRRKRHVEPELPAYTPVSSVRSDYGTNRQLTLSPKSMLNSNSAFIDFDNVGHYPDDFEDLPKQNGSARQRRRERIGISPRPESNFNLNLNPMGSTTSLDVDRIQKKNDARLRRLHNMNTDEVSNADPDEILDRFMAKQRHNRPPSGQTLQDDSWLNPAGGNPY